VAADLEFRFGGQLTELKSAITSLRNDFASLKRAAEQSGSGSSLRNIESAADGAAAGVKRLATQFLSVVGAIKLIGAADELNTLNARIKLVTNSTEEYNRAQVALFELAQRTRSSLGETINLYTRIAQATKDAGVGQETLLQVVETINQAVQLSGASSQAAEAALIQLGQGLASGTLRGEELNSVLEQTPALADAIAKGMGVTRGELRALGQEGKITAEQVIKAIQAQRDVVAKQFAQLPLTVGQATTQVKNSLLGVIGVLDQTAGATGGLASVMSDFAAFMSSDEFLGGATEFASLWSTALQQVVDDFGATIAIIEQSTGDMVGTGENAVQLLVRAFKELPVNIRTVVRVVATTFAGMVDSFVADAVLMKEAFAAIFTDDTIDAAIERRNAKVNGALQQVKDSIDDILEDRQKTLNDSAATGRAATQRISRSRQESTDPKATSLGNFKATQSADQKRSAATLRKAELDAEEKLLKDSLDRSKTYYENLYKDAKLSAQDYYAAREALELRAIDQAIEVEQRRVAAGGAERVKALAEIETLEREKLSVQQRIARERVEDEKRLAKEIAEAQAQELENQGRTADARRIRLEQQFRDTISRLQAEGNTAGVELIQRLINTDVARAQFEELKKEFDRITAQLQARQQSVQAQVATGSLSSETGQQQNRQERAEALAQLEALDQKMRELAQSTNDPEIVRGAEEAGAAIQKMAVESAEGVDAAVISLRSSLDNLKQTFAQTVTDSGVDALTGFFTDLASGSKSAGDALKDFARGFVQSMAQIAARAMATFLVLQLLDAVFPGAGKLVAGAGGASSAAVKHKGGMVGGPGVRRRVNPLLFAGAPRFHSGGMVGLQPGEVPAILQTGEEVLAKNDPRNAANGGGQGNGYRIVNVLDPSLVSGYLESASGERSVLNVISRNQGQVKQMIGA